MTTADLNTQTQFDAEWAARAAAAAKERGEPGWALEQRATAAALLKGMTFPARTEELWRRTDFRTVEQAIAGLDPFAAAPRARTIDDLPPSVIERLAGDAGQSALIVQRDGAVVFEQTHPELERQGVIVCSMERALREHGDLVRGLLGASLETRYDWYTALGTAIHAGGTFVHVPAGIDAAVPVQVFQLIEGAARLQAPRTVISLGKDSRATVIEEQFSSAAEGLSLHLSGTEVYVGDGAKLIYGTLQDWSRNVYHYSNARARVGRDAELQWIQTLLGARMAKANAYFDMAGQGAQAFVHGFMFGDQRQHFHLHTLQRHLVEHTTSDLLIKGCLKDRARSIYQGLIQVSEGAQRTDAYQANRNLLLSDQARADSIPGLEILANDVRCTHGATIGHVDEEQMYYLMARGLPAKTAQRLIVEGFFAPVLDRIPLEGVRERLRGEIETKIG